MRGAFLKIAASALILSLPGPAFAGQLGGAPDTDGVSALRFVAALGLCLILGLAGAVALRLRRDGGDLASAIRSLMAAPGMGLLARPRASARLKVLETVRVSPQVEICIVRCDRIELVVASGPGGLAVLASGEAGGDLVARP